MYVGPGGADALWSGSVARQASNATRNSGRNRRSAIAIVAGSLSVNAMNQALKVLATQLRFSAATVSSRFAWMRSVEACARFNRESVSHLAAEYPVHAVTLVTTESSTASRTAMTSCRRPFGCRGGRGCAASTALEGTSSAIVTPFGDRDGQGSAATITLGPGRAPGFT